MAELVTIICTVKNGENTIKSTIESIINQTYFNWKMIIIDDGSTDSTVSILRNYSDNYNKISFIETGGIGRGKALNMAIDLSKGTYVANIDADDIMHPEKLRVQVEYLSNNKDTFLVSTESEYIYNDSDINWKPVSENEITFSNVNAKLLVKNVIGHSTVVMDKKRLISLGKYNESRTTQIDYDLWLRACLEEEEMVIIHEKLLGKRIHTNQSYENKKRLRYILNQVTLQINHLILEKKYYLIPLPVATLFLGMLPFNTRRKLNEILFKTV